MNLKKKELIITIIMIVTLLVIGINASVFASTSLVFPGSNTANTIENDTIERVNTTNVTPNTTQNTTNNVNNATNNTPGQLANTGLEDAPWLIIGVCIISAVFAYNKIKEYKSI